MQTIPLKKPVDLKEIMGTYLNKTPNSIHRVSTRYVFEGFIEEYGSEVITEINWKFVTTLAETVVKSLPAISRKSMDKLINVILSEAKICKEVAEFLVINNVPEHTFNDVKTSLRMDAEAAAILRIAGI